MIFKIDEHRIISSKFQNLVLMAHKPSYMDRFTYIGFLLKKKKIGVASHPECTLFIKNIIPRIGGF